MLFRLPHCVREDSVLEYLKPFVLVVAYGSFVERYAKSSTKCVGLFAYCITFLFLGQYFFSRFSINLQKEPITTD